MGELESSVKTRLSVNASSSYADFRSVELNAENSGFDANGFVNFQQTLPWDLNLSVFGGGGSPRVMLQENPEAIITTVQACRRVS